jgi:hypothetical protein
MVEMDDDDVMVVTLTKRGVEQDGTKSGLQHASQLLLSALNCSLMLMC